MIEKVLQTNTQKEEDKRQTYYYKQGVIEQRKKILEEEEKERIQKKKIELINKEDQRKNVLFVIEAFSILINFFR